MLSYKVASSSAMFVQRALVLLGLSTVSITTAHAKEPRPSLQITEAIRQEATKGCPIERLNTVPVLSTAPQSDLLVACLRDKRWLVVPQGMGEVNSSGQFVMREVVIGAKHFEVRLSPRPDGNNEGFLTSKAIFQRLKDEPGEGLGIEGFVKPRLSKSGVYCTWPAARGPQLPDEPLLVICAWTHSPFNARYAYVDQDTYVVRFNGYGGYLAVGEAMEGIFKTLKFLNSTRSH